MSSSAGVSRGSLPSIVSAPINTITVHLGSALLVERGGGRARHRRLYWHHGFTPRTPTIRIGTVWRERATPPTNQRCAGAPRAAQVAQSSPAARIGKRQIRPFGRPILLSLTMAASISNMCSIARFRPLVICGGLPHAALARPARSQPRTQGTACMIATASVLSSGIRHMDEAGAPAPRPGRRHGSVSVDSESTLDLVCVPARVTRRPPLRSSIGTGHGSAAGRMAGCRAARGAMESQDLVQETLTRVFQRLPASNRAMLAPFVTTSGRRSGTASGILRSVSAAGPLRRARCDMPTRAHATGGSHGSGGLCPL